jgi:alpha-L-fucosidase
MERTKWFEEARFGMFIHWGVYSVLGRGEWVMFQENIPKKEYEEIARRFKCENYNPEGWVKIAKEAGMKYIVLTTRHHDGYSLFDSKASDFNSKKIGPKRDLVEEFVSACRKHNMKIGFYYSLIDWRWESAYGGSEKNPSLWDELVEYVHFQVKELMTNYGKIDILWYDGNFYVNEKRETVPTKPEHWKADKLNKMVRELQPEIIINNRTGLPEDFDTPEQIIRPSPPGRLWETCMTMNLHWGYFSSDNLWKPAKQLIHYLTGCVGSGGNYLLNVGPMSDGKIPLESIKRLKEIGKWLKINGEAIYGAGRCNLNSGTSGVFTSKKDVIYLIVHWWHGEKIVIPFINVKIKSGYILKNKKKVKLVYKGDRLFIEGLPIKEPDPLSTVIKFFI